MLTEPVNPGVAVPVGTAGDFFLYELEFVADGSGVNCPGPVTVTVEGPDLRVIGIARDPVGNNSAVGVSVNLDKTAPSIAPTLDPVANPAGWNNTNVVVGFDCDDSLSGVDSCEPVRVVTTEGSSPIDGSATDRAGNAAAAFDSIEAPIEGEVVEDIDADPQG